MQRVIIILFFMPFLGIAQNLVINSGEIFLNSGSALSIYKTSVNISSGFIETKDSTSIVITGDTLPIELDGAGIIKADSLEIIGKLSAYLDIQTNCLRLNQGNFILQNATVNVDSFLLDENDDFYVSGNKLEHQFDGKSGQIINPANFGLSLFFSEDEPNLIIERNNQFVFFNDQFSIKKQFQFNRVISSVDEVTFKYFSSDLGDPHREEIFKVFSSKDGFDWVEETSLSPDTSQNTISATIQNDFKYLTLLEGEPDLDLFIPNGFSPNNDGLNDEFEILGLNKFPNNKFVVFDNSGAVLFEAQPYQNNWEGFTTNNVIGGAGNSLPTGTYFYMFYPNVDESSNLMQGFIELRGGRR